MKLNKASRFRSSIAASFICGALVAHFTMPAAQAATLYWDGAATTVNTQSDNATTTAQNWISGGNWDNGSTSAAKATWTASDSAVFGGTAATQTITASALTIGNMTFGQGGLGAGTSGTAYTISGAVTLTLSASTITTNTPATISSVLGGATTLTKAGAATLTLSGANTYTGVTTISAGTVKLGNATALGTAAGNTTISSGATLDLNGQTTTEPFGTITGTGVGTNGALINSSATAASITGQITGGNFTVGGTGNITFATATSAPVIAKIGTNTLTLGGTADNVSLALNVTVGTVVLGKTSTTGVHAFGGASTVSGGTIQLGGSGDYQMYGGTSLTVNSGGVLDLNGKNQNYNGLGGNLNLNGTGISSGGALINSAAATTSTLTLGTGSIALQSASSIGGTGNIVVSGGTGANGAISGTVALTKVGAGTLTLAAANTYTGATTVSAGTLKLGSATALGATSGNTTIASGATLDLNGQTVAEPFGTISGTGAGGVGALINSSGTPAALTGTITGGDFSVGGTGNISLSQVTGGAVLTKVGSGAVTLSSATTYTGATNVTGGRLTVTGAGTMGGTSGLTVGNGAAFFYQPATLGTPLALGAGSTLTLNDGSTLGLTWDATTVSKIAVTGAATVGTGAGVLLNMTGIFTSGTTYTVLQAGSGLGAGSYFLSNPTDFTAVITKSNTAVTITPTAAGSALTAAFWKGGLSGAPNVWAVSDGAANSNWVTTAEGGATALVPGAGADVIISATAVTTAPTAMVLGANMAIKTLTVADTTNGLGLSADIYTLTITPGVATDGIVMNASVPASSIAANLALGADQTWTNHSANTLTVGGPVSGAFALTKAGSGTLVLTGANTYSGGTTVNGGTLQLGNGTVNGTVTSGLYQLAGGTTLVLNNATAVQAATGGWATRVRGSGTLRLNSAQAVNGTANWGPNLATATPFDSGFTGTLQMDKGRIDSNPTGLGGITNVVINSGAQFMAWTGTFPQNFTLAGNGWGESGFNGALRTAGSSNNATFSGNITLTADAGFNAQDTSTVMTISGGISGGFGISKEGSGPLTLTGTNSYGGATTLTAGTLQIKGSAGLPTASAINLGSATLQYLDDGVGSNGTISRTGNTITLTLASTTDTINVGNNGSANIGNTVAFGALNNGTAANAFASTINFTGSNGYLQSYTSLGLSGLTGNNTTLNPTTTSVTILGNVTNQESGTLTAHFDTLTLGGTSTGNAINGVISDATGYVGPVGNGDTRVTKSGTSTWTLIGSNTYSGLTTISGGVLRITNALALGTTTSGTTQSGTSALEIDGTGGAVIVGAETLTITGGGITNLGALRNLVGDNSYGGTVTLAAQSRINSDSGTLTLNNATAVTGAAQNLVIGGAGNITISGAITTTTGFVAKDGSGTLVLSGANTYTGGTTVSAGTLVISGTPSGTSAATVNSGGTLQLDYSTNDTGKIDDLAILTLAGGTLDLKGGTQTEIVASTTLTAGTASRVTSSTTGSVLRMNTITPGAGATIDFGAAGIATTDNPNNSLGILGTWATIGGTDFAVNSTNDFDGPITAAPATEVARRDGIPALQVINNSSSTNIRIIEGTGSAANITLGAATTTVNTLTQSASGGTSAAVIDPNGQTLLANGILVGSGAGALAIGTGTNSGTLGTATAGGDLTIVNSTANSLTIHSVIADNTTASTLTKTGTGPATLSGANTYAGGTVLTAGTLQLGNAGALGTGPLTLVGGILDSAVPNLVNANNNPQAWNGNFSFLGTQALNLGTGAVTTNGARTVTVSANTLTVGGSFTPSATAGSHLTKLGAGTLVLNGTAALGNNGIIVNGGTVRFGGTLTTNSAVAGAGVNTFKVGNLANASAAFVQTGGSIVLSVNDVDGMNLGNADNASGAFGSLTIAGGSFSAPRLNVGGSGVTTGTNGVGLLNVLSGGSATLTAYLIGARGATNSGATTIAGGTLDLSGVGLTSGHIGTYGGGRQEYNIGANLGGGNSGGLITTGANPFSAVANGNTGIGIANLLGGTLLVNAVTSPAGTATGVGINQFNFNGGTLKCGTAANTSFVPAIAAGAAPGSGVFVRSGGATIDTNGQNNITIAAALLAPTGGEVTGITATGATGFITAPYVKIVGGNNDATAIAQIDGSGTVTNILVTNPGTGYATAPTVTLVGGTAAGGTNIATGIATATVGASTSGGLTKTGTGFLVLSGANTYTGVTTINAGTITANSLMPSTSFVVNSGGQLYGGWLIPGATYTNNLTISGTGYLEGGINNGALRASNNQTFSGPITLAADSRISMIEAAAASTYSGQITGSFALDVQGSFTGNAVTQTFTLANTGAANSYTGNTSISAVDYGSARTGVTTILRLGANDQLPNGAGMGNLVFNGADANHLTILELNGFNETLNGLSNTAAASAIIRNSTVGASTLTIGDADAASTFSGVITDGGIGKTLAITKVGAGTLALSGANTYGGNTTVNAGTLTLSNAPDPLNANPGNDASTVTIAATGATLDLTFTGTDKVDKLFIGASQMPAGVYGKAGSLLPVIGIAQITGDGTLTVGSFASWIAGSFANGAVPLGKRGPNDDPDNDGISNLMEYAIAGQDPTVGNTAIGTFDGTTLSFTKRADTTGLTYAIVQSTDLGVLVPWSEVSGPTYTNNATTISFTLTPGTPPKNFVRLRVLAN